MDAKYFVLPLIVAIQGCAAVCPHPAQTPPAQLVTTGGPYCIPRSIPIPPEGLALGAVIDDVLRPGVERAANVIAAPASAARPVALPLGQQKVNPQILRQIQSEAHNPDDKTLKSAAKAAVWDVEQVEPILVALPELTNDEERTLLEADILACLRRAVGQGFHGTNAEANSQAADRLRRELAVTIAFRNLWANADQPTPQLFSVASKRIVWLMNGGDVDEKTKTKFDSDVEKVQDVLKVAASQSKFRVRDDLAHIDDAIQLLPKVAVIIEGEKVEAVAAPTQSQAATQTIYDSLVVVLTRRGGRSIIAPLFMVRAYSVGDIWLVDGDHIQVLPYSRTTAGLPPINDTDGHILIDGISKATGILPIARAAAFGFRGFVDNHSDALADVALVRRVAETGHLEEYLLPLPRSEIYGPDAPSETYLAQTSLQSGDQVHFESLDLTPLIRDSRQKFQLASVQRELAAGCHRKLGWFSRSPHVSQATAPIRNSVSGVDSQFKQFTGVGSSDIAKSVDNLHKNFAGQLPITNR